MSSTEIRTNRFSKNMATINYWLCEMCYPGYYLLCWETLMAKTIRGNERQQTFLKNPSGDRIMATKFRIIIHKYDSVTFPIPLMDLDFEKVSRQDIETNRLSIVCDDHIKALEACRICIYRDIPFDMRYEQDLTEDEINMIKTNRIIPAIKSVRIRTEMGLKEAKDYVMQKKSEMKL